MVKRIEKKQLKGIEEKRKKILDIKLQTKLCTKVEYFIILWTSQLKPATDNLAALALNFHVILHY